MNTDHVQYRLCRPTDLLICLQIERASYPPDEAATESSLQYRQQNATPYFMVAVTSSDDAKVSSSSENPTIADREQLIGFVCSTRCDTFTHDSMTIHTPGGTLLAIHSVVVSESYRRRGIATAMLRQYIQTVVQPQPSVTSTIQTSRPSKIVLLAKANMLSFYVNCGFQVMRPSSICHGREQWYDLEMSLNEIDSLDKSTITGRSFYIVDAFADPNRHGTGNPAAIVPLDCEPMDVNWMQVVAQEMNLSETAFVWKIPQMAESTSASEDVQSNYYGIRYFTPKIEVDLCGHATLASAAILYTVQKCTNVVFHANHSVVLLASHKQTPLSVGSTDSKCAQMSMTFPTQNCSEILRTDNDYVAVEAMLLHAFPTIASDDILFIGNVPGLGDLLVEVKHDAFLHDSSIDVNTRALLEWDGYSLGIVLCCVSGTELNQTKQDDDDNIDFYSRFFAPKAGVDEDPVTGSAHTALAPYFSNQFHKKQLVGQQKSLRGGIVLCDMSDDGRTVTLSGTAITTASGTLWM